jgi:hypothetical protein
MHRPLALALLLAAPGAFAAGKPTTLAADDIATATRLRDQALQDDTAWDFTEGLTTEVGARLAGGDNDLKAREWVIAKFKALGFDKVWSEPVPCPIWVRRSESGAIVAPFAQPLVLAALGNSPGTPAGGLQAEVVAFESFEALQAADDASVRGRIVFVNARMQAHRDGHTRGTGRHLGRQRASARRRPIAPPARERARVRRRRGPRERLRRRDGPSLEPQRVAGQPRHIRIANGPGSEVAR